VIARSPAIHALEAFDRIDATHHETQFVLVLVQARISRRRNAKSININRKHSTKFSRQFVIARESEHFITSMDKLRVVFGRNDP
jgi:urease gamma subunit